MIYEADIKKLIKKKKANNLKNHFFTFICKDHTKFIGYHTKNKVQIWNSTPSNSIFYPVFNLLFNNNEILTKVVIERNPLTKVIDKIILIIIASLVVFQFYFSNLRPAIGLTIIVAIMYFLYIFVVKKIIRKENEILIKEFNKELFKIENCNRPDTISNEAIESEWTTSKIFSRILIYLFCFFIIYLSLTEFLPKGNIKFIYGLLIPIAFIISDILIVIKSIKK